MTWLPIKYREFYDIPRAFVVERGKALYFFDCPFDPDLDDYPEEYSVYRLPASIADQVDAMSWVDLGARGDRIGRVPASSIRLDESRRGYIDDRVFELL